MQSPGSGIQKRGTDHEEIKLATSTEGALNVALVLDYEARFVLASAFVPQSVNQFDLAVAQAGDPLQNRSARFVIVVKEAIDEKLRREEHQIVDSSPSPRSGPAIVDR